MELPVIDNIIFGTLQPWQVVNKNEQTFYDLLRSCSRTIPETVQDLNKTTQTLLRDHPHLYKPLTGDQDTVLPAPFYDIALPKPFNSTTEFYLLIMQCTALQFMYELTQSIDKTTHDTEAYYIINSTLEKIKYLAAGATNELQRQGLTDIPNYQTENTIAADEQIKRNTHFTLFSAKQITTRIFFEVQARFTHHVKAVENEEHFYLHTLKEPAPEQSILKPTFAYYARKVEQLIQGSNFSFDEATNLHKQLNSLSYSAPDLKAIQTALENYIFSHSFEIEVKEGKVTGYAKALVTNGLFTEVKTDIEKSISRLDKGYKRLEVITAALDKLVIVPENETASAITKLHKWLQQQQTLFTTLYSEKFPVETEEPKTDQAKAPAKISFGFTGDKAKLKTVIIELTRKVELLNEDRSSTDELLTILTSKDIKPAGTQIYLNCETVQFRYIIDKLKTYFTNLTPTEIHKAECFYSKKANLIKSQNLYSNKIDTPKDQSTIDNIINHLQ